MADERSYKRLTRFPGDQPSISRVQSESAVVGKKKTRRMTRFPGGTEAGLPLLTVASLKAAPIEKHEEGIQTERVPRRLPLVKKIQPPSPKIEETATAIDRPDSPLELAIHHQNPWDIYRLVREIGRGGKTKAANTRCIPTRMVTVKDVNVTLPSSTVLGYRHQNLVEVMGLYKFQGKTVLISEYAQVTLKRVIAIPLDLEEVHVSTICGQVMVTYPSFE